MPLGVRVQQLVGQSILSLWPNATGDHVLGVGFPTPYLEPYLAGATISVCMPGQQGAAYWPLGEANRVCLAHESELPLQENSVNRVLLMHAMEHSEQLSWMMSEVWRVLTPGGRVLAVVPSRLGFWSRSSRSPFGYGRPFSLMQLRDLMTEHQFTPTRSASALFIPPFRSELLWKMAPKIEQIGKTLCWFMGGVLLVEAEKQVYAAVRPPVAPRRVYAPRRATQTAMGRRQI